MLLRSLVMLPFIDATSFADASGQLFGDPALLLQLGYTAVEIREGFNDRYRNGLGQKSAEALPLHPAVLREELRKATVAEKQKANPNYGTVFNIGNIFKDE